jgi:hypothetical protein
MRKSMEPLSRFPSMSLPGEELANGKLVAIGRRGWAISAPENLQFAGEHAGCAGGESRDGRDNSDRGAGRGR